MRILALLLVVIVVLAPAATVAQTPAGTGFTYQGQLVQSGVEVSGDADFVFALYDAATGGNQIGSDLFLYAVPVEQGVFSVDLDFGASAFTGDARFLQIQVRTPSTGPGGAEPYDTLLPRQELTPVPYAIHALNAASGDGVWQLDGTGITNTNSGFVGINGSTPLTFAEVFGVRSPATTGYGGMYMSTEGADAWPFIGFDAGGTRAWTYLHGGTDSWRLYNGGERLTVERSGDVGIGTLTPQSKLEVVGTIHSTSGGFKFPDGTVQTTAAEGAVATDQVLLTDGSAVTTVEIYADDPASTSGGSVANFNDENGTKTIEIDGNIGDGGQISLRNSQDRQTVNILGDYTSGNGGLVEVDQGDGTTGVRILGHGGFGTSDRGGEIQIDNAAGQRAVTIASNYGGGTSSRIVVDVVEIRGGSDLSEQFDVTPFEQQEIEPGSVVSIDPGAPGDLRISDRAYDRRVAGVISGAGGVNPGMLMGQRGSEADGEHPVALTGRVYVKVDARHGAIEPGDLLTSSPTPGHAMKVTDHARATGAILGKAMTGLESGTGMVLLLVSLQ
ncbi:MAG TPA: hypothetical protein VKA86_14880 [Candidatus Krumholzibacteria bacterium]|nr:hypothetical protein [Candidatus Krumholzibacteria bacterium]